MHPKSLSTTAKSLCRAIQRQIEHLPSVYLRNFFRIKLGDDVNSALSAHDRDGRRTRKFKKLEKELSKMKSACSGNMEAMEHILDLAYGRKGKLRRELMEPFLNDPSAPIPDRIIPAVEKSRPPIYSKELAALLTSPHSHKTRPLKMRHLACPPTIPPRADPSSDEARLLGPFSKRRLVNLHHRFFATEEKKVYPPLQITLQDQQSSDADSLIRQGIRGTVFQGSGIMEEVLAIAGPPSPASQLTRRERRAPGDLPSSVKTEGSVAEVFANQVPSQMQRRWLRRRYQRLLYTLPILNYSPPSQGQKVGKYQVQLSPSAIGPDTRYTGKRSPFVDEGDIPWITEDRNNLTTPNSRAEAVLPK